MQSISRIAVVAVTVAYGFAGNNAAEAGVRGRSYFGTITNSIDETGRSCMSFAGAGNTFAWDRDFGSGPVGWYGTYTEIDLGIVSVWFANFTNDPTTAWGISILSRWTTFSATNPATGISATGFYTEAPNCVPTPPTSRATPETSLTLRK